ncbi:MAG: glycerol-3-phosphate 1-O-acyltransferase PlsY [Candidatus Omnitrophota bacterium]
MSYFILFLGGLLAYLIGSIPTAYIAGKLVKSIDIRQFGSGNIGATNTFRVVGKMPGVAVLLIDMLKGYMCVTYCADLFMLIAPVERPELYRVLMGLSAIMGHNWTVFLNFKGGKGVATSAGVIIALIPKIFLLGLIVWSIIFGLTGYVSLSSIIAAILIPIFTFLFNKPVETIVAMCILCMVVVYKHRSNIARLKKGEERKIKLFKKGKK